MSSDASEQGKIPLPATMISPGMKRPNVWRWGVLQIHLTRACDKSCFGCTQGSNLGGKTSMMTLEQFEQACQSLSGYFGVVGIFGGNPCLHPQFDRICEILREYVPRERRGLWSNNLNGWGAVCRATFNPAVSNLNVHLDKRAYDEMRRDWPEAKPFGLDSDSRHWSPYVAMIDLDELPFPDGTKRPNTEANRWELIGQCDVNQNWSAMICVFRGELRGYFCEIAAAQAILHQYEPDYPDLGLPVTPQWWAQGMDAFEQQARFHCHGCGVPLRGFGELAIGGATEQVSTLHESIYKPKKKDRPVQLIQLESELRSTEAPATHYMQKAGG